MTRPTSCRATHDHLTCCRIREHVMPHMAADGTQRDEHGIRQNRGNDPYKEHVR